MTETNGVCVVCERPEWTTTVALSGKVSPFNACHRVKGDPITFNTIDCYKTGYQNRSAQRARAHAEGLEAAARVAEEYDPGERAGIAIASCIRSLIPAAITPPPEEKK